MFAQKLSARKSPPRRRSFETLEPKRPLAGDVWVAVIDGHLAIHGDELGNQIGVHSGPDPGSFVITGRDGTRVHLRGGEEGGDGTSEANTSEVVVHGVHRGISARMGDGDDVIALNHARVRGQVAIGTGNGSDIVLIGEGGPAPTPESPSRQVAIGGNLLISTGNDNDSVVVETAEIHGGLFVSTDGGNDRVRLGGLLPDPSAATESAASPDSALLRVAGPGTVALGAGDDGVGVRNVAIRGLRLEGGLGGDTFVLGNVQTSHLSIEGGRGDASEDITLHRVRAEHARIQTGAGNDRVEIADSVFAALGVSLGEGDDVAALRGNRARLAILLGGAGDRDALINRENEFGQLYVRGFEILAEPTGSVTPARRGSLVG